MRWHRKLTHRHKPEDSSDEVREAIERIEAHREEELRTMAAGWDAIIRERLEGPGPQPNQVRSRRKRTPGNEPENDPGWGSPDEATPARVHRVS